MHRAAMVGIVMLVVLGLFALYISPAHANSAPCSDQNHHPRWCWQTDNDKLTLEVQSDTIKVPAGARRTIDVTCDQGDLAVSASYEFVNRFGRTVLYPQGRFAATFKPIFAVPNDPEHSSPVGYRFSAINLAPAPYDVTLFGYVTCAH